MTRLKIADILATSPVDPEAHLDPDRVERYRQSVDRVAPVVVFDTEDGLLLADGYHRVAAALREGREIIEAEVRSGSRHEALERALVRVKGGSRRNPRVPAASSEKRSRIGI